jgi:hypothetical protein
MKIGLQLIGLIILVLGLVLVIGTDYGIRQMVAVGMIVLGAILIILKRFWNRNK